MSNRCKIVVLQQFRFVTEGCNGCGTLFAMAEDLWDRRLKDGRAFYCPNGHSMSFQLGKSDEQKLKDAITRETALKDQLAAAVHETEQTRGALLRDRQRFANGVCPCCNRSFDNVRRHMTTQHPDYDVTKVQQPGVVEFKCSCRRTFATLHGLHIHQSRQRGDGWAKRAQGDSWDRRMAHTTVV